MREGKNRIVKLKEGDPAGKHVVIVDDLVQSGSTLIECQKVLAARGASRVSAFATHGVFPNRSWKRFTHDRGGEKPGLKHRIGLQAWALGRGLTFPTAGVLGVYPTCSTCSTLARQDWLGCYLAARVLNPFLVPLSCSRCRCKQWRVCLLLDH